MRAFINPSAEIYESLRGNSACRWALASALIGGLALGATGCGEVTTAPDAGGGNGEDGGGGESAGDASIADDASSADDAVDASPDGAAIGEACTPDEALRCEGDDLVRCNGDGTAEESVACPLGCSTADLRCLDLDPSNDLADYLDATSGKEVLSFTDEVVVDTTSGQVTAGGDDVVIETFLAGFSPQIRVLAVGVSTYGI